MLSILLIAITIDLIVGNHVLVIGYVGPIFQSDNRDSRQWATIVPSPEYDWLIFVDQ